MGCAAPSPRPFDARGLAARVSDGPLVTTAAVSGAGGLLASAVVHLAQLVSIFHAVPWIGPLFGADVVASAVIAIAIVTTRRRVAAALGALVSAGALAGLALASTLGLLGWHEDVLRPAVLVAIASELLAVASLVPLALPTPPRRSARSGARATAAVGLVAVAGLHLAAAADEWTDARGVFWLFIALAAACLALALRLAQGLDRWSWAAVFALAAAPLAGYLVSRTTGLPGDASDIGDWTNGVGLGALAAEAALLVVALGPLRAGSCSPRTARRSAHAPTRSSAAARVRRRVRAT